MSEQQEHKSATKKKPIMPRPKGFKEREDAVKNMGKRLNIIENATKKFIETMETVNSVFVDIGDVSQVVYSSCIPNLPSFKYDKYYKELDKSVERYTI